MPFKKNTAVIYAVLAALLFGISSPAAKILLAEIPPTLMAALLYLGAGIGISLLNVILRLRTGVQGTRHKEAPIGKKDLPFVLGMIILDIAAPVFLMLGLTLTSAANASLLNNFEIVATSMLALLFFRETIGRRLWSAIILITLSTIILSLENIGSFSFSFGSLLVLLACLCWGLENNCTRMLSLKNPMEVVILKGFGSGCGALLLAFFLQEKSDQVAYILGALLLGFVSYGLSIFFYVSAQRELGAARTSAYYAFAPFAGVALSFVIFREIPTISFGVALLLMAAGAYLAASEKHNHVHPHEGLTHEHRHNHEDSHHNHGHQSFSGEHSHLHMHEKITHSHRHTPDTHHAHCH